MKRKLLALFMITTMTLSLVACGETKDTDNNSTNAVTENESVDYNETIESDINSDITENNGNESNNYDENGKHLAYSNPQRWLTDQDFSGEPSTNPLVDFDAKYNDDAEDVYQTLDLPLTLDHFESELYLWVENNETHEMERLNKDQILSSPFIIEANRHATFWYYHNCPEEVEASNNDNQVGYVTVYNNSDEDMTLGKCFENNWFSYAVWCSYYGQFGYDYDEKSVIENPNDEDLTKEVELINFMTYAIDNILGTPSKVIMSNNLFGYVEEEELANAYLDSTMSLYDVTDDDKLAVDSFTLVWEYEDRVFTIMLTDGHMISHDEIVPSMGVSSDSDSGEFFTIEQWEYSKDNIADEDKNILPYMY
ncbi:MAG: hypothetical protein IJZ79_02865 [Bacilli bacterium]|nr:hypothetical protein [Bacilli bacterium]MBQ8218667.1 hypothetical protein [Bacilli bacterium]